MESGAWILMSMAYYIITFIVWFAVEGGSGCSVTPSAVAVVAGDSISLTCTTTDVINGWKRGSNSDSSSIVFQAPAVYGRNNSVPRIVVDGYFVDDSLDHQVILIMNSTSTVQADHYYCLCFPSSYRPTATVTVLVTKPTFSTTNQTTDGEPVNFTCSISFNGTADASLAITDISGTKVAEKSERGTYPSTSTDLHVINLDYNTTANPSVNQTYFCQINLTDNSRMIYSEQLVTSVPVSVRNVQINPVDETRCSNNSQCAINQMLICTAEGNPYPVVFQWTAFLNGSHINKNTSGQFTLTSTGNYTVQCTAFNSIGGITYSSTSGYFKTEVTVEGPPTPLPDTQNIESKTGLIVGLVVGLGCAIIFVSLIVVFILCKRKKSRTVCCNPDDKETRSNQGVELSKHHNGNNSTDNGVQNKSFVKSGNDEVTLVENDLYSGKQSKTQIDPSDGGYASVNEVMQQSK